MKRILIALALASVAAPTWAAPLKVQAIDPSVLVNGVALGTALFKLNIGAANGVAGLDANGTIVADNGWKNFDTVGINPDQGGYTSLPSVANPCHQIGQVYVLAYGCLATQASSPAETYAYSFNLANTDPGGTGPAAGQPGATGTDKVAVYVGADEQSSNSNLWGVNEVVQARAAGGGVTGAEWDLNRYNPCNTATDLSWVGHTASCPQFIGQWITGLSGGGTGGPAMMITGVGSTPLWNDGIAILGATVRDTGYLDTSDSTAAFKAVNTHIYGLDLSTSSVTKGVHFSSGYAGQGIYWDPGAGATDSILDSGQGLTLNTDSSHTMNFSGANMAFTTGAIVLQDLQNPVANNPYMRMNSDGSWHMGQFNIATGGLSVDGTIRAGNIVQSGFVAPATSTSACTVGQAGDAIVSGTSYHYACVATNSWVRVAMAAW